MQQAKNLSATFEKDPQIRLPLKPRMTEDFVKLWYNRQTLVMLGGLGEVVLRGKSVGSLLTQLMPLLSGRWTLPELIERLPGVKPSAVEDALFLLYTQGLLECGSVAGPTLTREKVQHFASQLLFYSRYVDYTRANRSRFEVLDKMQASSIVLLGGGTAARRVLDELISLGLGHVSLLALDDADSWRSVQGPHARVETLDLQPDDLRAGEPEAIERFKAATANQRVLLLVSDQPEPKLTRLLNQVSIEREIPFLRSYLCGSTVEIGPAVFAGQSSCYECAHLLNQIDLDASQPAPGADADWLSPEEQIGVSQTALFVLSLLTKFTPIRTGNMLYRLDAETLELQSHAVYTLPGCPACSPVRQYEHGRDLRIGAGHAENWPTLYHFNTNERVYDLFPRGHQVHYAPKNTKTLTGAYKSYNNRERIALPPVERLPAVFAAPFPAAAWSPEASAGRETPLTAADLTLLLQIVAGRPHADARIGFRLTPSAGGLGSQTLYLINFAAPGLDPGVYHFNPQGSLERLRGGNLRQEVDRAVPGAEDVPGNVLAAVVLTSAFGRVESKYFAKSYRYIFYDGGAMLHNLQAVSQILGFDLWQSANFYDDEINAVLGIHSIIELPLCVTYLTQQ